MLGVGSVLLFLDTTKKNITYDVISGRIGKESWMVTVMVVAAVLH